MKAYFRFCVRTLPNSEIASSASLRINRQPMLNGTTLMRLDNAQLVAMTGKLSLLALFLDLRPGIHQGDGAVEDQCLRR
jgi:hypothetical protein